MVTHGGLNGIREAMTLAVPAVVLPFDIDQPGNAARIQHHGYGRLLRWDGLTATKLAETIPQVLEDDALRARVSALSQRLQLALEARQAAGAFMGCWAAARSVLAAHTKATSTPGAV
jgi:UDP:flavonoid glycosyltransferase YjiC (YdhE family)